MIERPEEPPRSNLFNKLFGSMVSCRPGFLNSLPLEVSYLLRDQQATGAKPPVAGEYWDMVQFGFVGAPLRLPCLLQAQRAQLGTWTG